MKDLARLLGYFAAVICFGALVSPQLFWSARALSANHFFAQLAAFDFETYFHRAVLVGAVIFLWPLVRSVGISSWRDLGLKPNPCWCSDLLAGFLFAALPLAILGAVLIFTHQFALRETIRWSAIAVLVLTAAVVPLIEELLFRGLFLGLLLRRNPKWFAIVFVSALFSIIHFLKSPTDRAEPVTWSSGFVSIAHAFVQFRQPTMLLAGFTTLFLIALILADARVRTDSLWLPIGLHAGWIFASGSFNKVARREFISLPWLGSNLLIGVVPLAVAAATWALLFIWFRRRREVEVET